MTTTEPAAPTLTVDEVTMRLAIVRAVSEQVAGVETQLRDQAKTMLSAGDRKAAVLDDATQLGTVTQNKPTIKLGVDDEAALLAWVEATAPAEIETVETINPGYLPAVIALAKDLLDDDAVRTTRKIRDSYLGILEKKLVRRGEHWIDTNTGEIVPGVRVIHKDGNLTVRVDTQAVVDAYADGRLTLGLHQLLLDAPPETKVDQ